MSVVVSTCQQICNSPLNNSRSKQLFSFPKSKKFDDFQKPVCTQAFYDLPPVKSKRSTAFGYGNKYDFTKTLGQSPAPNSYNVRIDPNDEIQKKRGFSFGLSREAMAITGGMMVGDKNSPGPGAYDVRGRNKTTISFTFRPRTNLDGTASAKDVPGPGQYQLVESLNKTGKYFVSKFKNSGATIIAPRSFSKSGTLVTAKDVPGPGHYDVNASNMAANGSYFVSKFKSSLCRSFGHSMRKSQSSGTFAPGPGSYRLPSEFGHYESVKSIATQPKETINESPEKEAKQD